MEEINYRLLEQKTNVLIQYAKNIINSGIHLYKKSGFSDSFFYNYNKDSELLTVQFKKIKLYDEVSNNTTVPITTYQQLPKNIPHAQLPSVTAVPTPIYTNYSMPKEPTRFTIELSMTLNSIISLIYTSNQAYSVDTILNDYNENDKKYNDGKLIKSILVLSKTKIMVDGEIFDTEQSPKAFLQELERKNDFSLLYIFDIIRDW